MGVNEKNRTLILWLAAAIILYFTYMVKLKGNQGTLGFDEVITPFILQLTNHAVEDFLSVFEAVASKLGIVAIAGTVVFWLWRRKRDYKGIIIFLVAVGGGYGLNTFLKLYYGRLRPGLDIWIDSDSFGFPSGHAMVGTVLYTFTAYFIIQSYREAVWTRRIVPCSAALLIVLTGLSRVAAGAHYPSDVITGFAYGIKIYEIGNPRMIKTASEKGIRIGT
ncbi:phosphatase PAP2 family protein [Mesobacillus harenae]|uniref:phosphatase PAP2 family protein n=1 Tax=Mesobacillus harenae TaxID=2213203 RepID=UPI00157FC72F|nr:phosphatase PAP2 family protein [Mesobacillus harenae]